MSITTYRAALALALLTSATACDDGNENEPEARGHVVSLKSLGTLDVEAVKTYLGTFKLDPSRVQFGIRAYQVIYQTIDTKGAPTTASSYIAFPDRDADELRVVAWMHGTMVYRPEAASVNPESEDRASAVMFASAGYAVTAPDYLGLGDGPGFHPYDHAASEASAGLDALRALREVARDQDQELDDQVLISGFSQGGPAAMALGRALDRGDDPDFEVGGIAPISGPYHYSETLHTAVTSGIAFATAYVSYLMIAWDRVHDIYASPSDVFVSPYDATLEGLFDGNHSTDEIFDMNFPAALEDLFTPAFLEHMRAPTGTLASVLAEEDTTCDWVPRVPVTIYAATGDLDVPIANSDYCRAALLQRGAPSELVTLVNVGNIDHPASVGASLPLVLAQFEARP